MIVTGNFKTNSHSLGAHTKAFQCVSDSSDGDDADDAADAVAQPNGSASPTSATGADVAAIRQPPTLQSCVRCAW